METFAHSKDWKKRATAVREFSLSRKYLSRALANNIHTYISRSAQFSLFYFLFIFYFPFLYPFCICYFCVLLLLLQRCCCSLVFCVNIFQNAFWFTVASCSVCVCFCIFYIFCFVRLPQWKRISAWASRSVSANFMAAVIFDYFSRSRRCFSSLHMCLWVWLWVCVCVCVETAWAVAAKIFMTSGTSSSNSSREHTPYRTIFQYLRMAPK